MSASDGGLRSAQFRREREGSWRELEALVERIEARGLSSLSAGELNRLPVLYRGAISAQSVARSISLDRALDEYLTALVARAHLSVYGTDRSLGAATADFLRHRFPAAVRAHARAFWLALALLAAGILTGFQLTAHDPDWLYTFVDAESTSGRDTTSSRQELREILYSGGDQGGSGLALFASTLFNHNAKIGLLCFALGFAAAAPIPFLLFANGATLGALWALYDGRQLGMEFCAWVFPHAVTELLAVVLCATAGLSLGAALVFPGRHGRLEELALAGRRGAPLVIGAVLLFLIAALLEGFFRQLVHNVDLRALTAVATTVLWSAYFLFAGREPRGDRPR